MTTSGYSLDFDCFSATTWENNSQYSLTNCLRAAGSSLKYIGLSMSICIASLGVMAISFRGVVYALLQLIDINYADLNQILRFL